jgi:hypothetical protein
MKTSVEFTLKRAFCGTVTLCGQETLLSGLPGPIFKEPALDAAQDRTRFPSCKFGTARIIALLMTFCTSCAAHAEVIVVPNALATTDGNFFHDGGPVPIRVMQIYDASQFATVPGPLLITQFAYRPDTIPGPSGPRTLTLRAFASTTSRSVAELSSTFAENIGSDNRLIFDGTLVWDTANLAGAGNTRQFDIPGPLTTPFLYDPRAGNLVLDFQIASAGGVAIRRDAVSGDPAVNFLASFGSATATTGTVFEFAFVTQFTVQSVPELPGDYNEDGKVDAADYVVWRYGLGTTYTPGDYNIWRAHFGQTAGSGAVDQLSPVPPSAEPLSAAVPEPTSAWLWGACLACASATIRRSSQRGVSIL